MKKQFLAIVAVYCLLFAFMQPVQAQRVSATLNVKAFNINDKKVTAPDGTEVKVSGETSFSGNLRLFTKSKFALRLGVGVDKLKYKIDEDDGLETDFDAKRETLTAYVGLEKHFPISFLTPYVGMYVPIRFNSKDIVDSLDEEIRDGDVKAGLSLLGGANIKLLKFLRLGAEFNVGFDKFKDEVIDNLVDGEKVKFNKLDYGLEFTVGVAF